MEVMTTLNAKAWLSVAVLVVVMSLLQYMRTPHRMYKASAGPELSAT